jgi:hypothetical protein
MALFQYLTGELYMVEATTAEEAEARWTAYTEGEDCPCEIPGCKCVEYFEAQTWHEPNWYPEKEHLIELVRSLAVNLAEVIQTANGLDQPLEIGEVILRDLAEDFRKMTVFADLADALVEDANATREALIRNDVIDEEDE